MGRFREPVALKQIYLDYNATTPISSFVLEAMLPYLKEHHGNPSSAHGPGRVAHEAVEDARADVATGLGADPTEITFTSGGTESNNLAIFGVMSRYTPESGAHFITSNFEHPAVAAPAAQLKKLGYAVTRVACDANGVVSSDVVSSAIRAETKLVSIMHANNEIGTLQPIGQIGERCRQAGVLFHTDAAQTVGKVATSVDALNVDLMSLAGHKVYAPKGIGALYIRRGVAVDPVTFGAGHEAGLRPGTENVPSIVGLGRALFLARRSITEASDRLAQIRDRLADRLAEGLPETMIHGARAERLPNTLSIVFPEVLGQRLLERTPDVCASTGSACHAGESAMSSTLTAIGASIQQAQGTVRLSVGWQTSEDEVDQAASSLLAAWESLH